MWSASLFYFLKALCVALFFVARFSASRNLVEHESILKKRSEKFKSPRIIAEELGQLVRVAVGEGGLLGKFSIFVFSKFMGWS